MKLRLYVTRLSPSTRLSHPRKAMAFVVVDPAVKN